METTSNKSYIQVEETEIGRIFTHDTDYVYCIGWGDDDDLKNKNDIRGPPQAPQGKYVENSKNQ